MASNAPGGSPSISPPSSPTTAPAHPNTSFSGGAPASTGPQSRISTSQTFVSSQSNGPSRQNTVPAPQAPRRTSTVQTFQTFQTTNTSFNNSTQSPVQPSQQGRRGSRPKSYIQRLHSAFSPSTHDIKEYDALAQGTSRPYDHRQQRKRLWLKTVTEFLITLVLCVTYFVILYLYHLDSAIDKKHRRIFNALVTGNALFLGINLQASLKSYVKMLRWNILATRYRPLKTFDLILGSDSITNVVKLVWHGRNKKHFPVVNLFTSTTSLLALAWIIIQLGIAVCVGVIGLTYNLNVDANFSNTQAGNTSTIDLHYLSTLPWLEALSEINAYGLKGDQISASLSPTLSYNDINLGNYLINDQGETRYFFVDFNPKHSDVDSISQRYIDCTVSCNRSIVTQGQYGLSKQIAFRDGNGKQVNETLYQAPGEGGVYAVADTNSTCGERCTNVRILQAGVTPENADSYANLYGTYKDQGTWFSCDVTVSDVQSNYLYPNWTAYAISPLLSRMLAGSYGWSANPLKDDRYVYQTYEVASELAIQFVPEVGDMVQQISEVTMDGIQFMDIPSQGLPRQFITNGYQPIQAQVLGVKWWAAGALLGAIPLVQFLTWMAVIATANRVIIKDDSPLSMAKVYWTLLGDHLGQHGCMLDNNQLIDEVGKFNVVYGYREGTAGSTVKHVDIFEEGRGCDPARSFPQGDYDGPGGLRKRKDRQFDAKQYF